jgi:thiosulfate/3-mercaptopyruvate sulfurtransferase
MISDTIISTGLLASHLNDPNWVIVDCRFDLAEPDWGGMEYQRAHIPGSIYAHLDKDLSGTRTPQTGRHPLPEPTEFRITCTRLGIDSKTQVIAYDSLGGAYAARLWWLLQDYGHKTVAVLDGGWQKWISEEQRIQPGVEQNEPKEFTGDPGHMPVVSTLELEEFVGKKHNILIDARSPERYAGIVEPIDPVAGHIPGAGNLFHGRNLNPDNTFLPPTELAQQYAAILKDYPSSKAIVYCGSGVTSCHHVLGMKIAGLQIPRLYAGSWSEWIRNPEHPTSTNP